MQFTASAAPWQRYIALGDSFTEGLNDADPERPDHYRGWADLLAGHLAAATGVDVEYANLAIRGRLLRQVVEEQVPVALEARPDLVSIVAGGNDLMRPGADPDELAATLEAAVVRFRSAGADVLLATGVDTRNTPILRRARGRIAVFNADIWSIAARTGAAVLDQWGAGWIQDSRLWDADRIHLTTEGHRRMGLAAAAALGVPVGDDGWRTPLSPQPPRAFRVAVAEEAAWVRGYVGPWIGRRLRGTSSGDGREPKRPVPLALPRP
ncbi:SGNH/GDSL hydrolase family protein [Blastococcus sp. TML/M2B]|uniref:SGNH/GDSL hydrolase family protein n=1 Tax=unclassified Blastococcus TaxID=2619396 RepID=UPI00190978B7|nr:MULTISPECIES: SGNH/GDSL hydrolase family protein [unclassified Blastococcus]MBN1092012.1 SGNH/GDSL hydrolase family protein [Blastococcus sp. TML/M2B]MBN1097887.1 SGNH/GDSL hydrolase family protein [Blastococcus sp. TML/C7B]